MTLERLEVIVFGALAVLGLGGAIWMLYDWRATYGSFKGMPWSCCIGSGIIGLACLFIFGGLLG